MLDAIDGARIALLLVPLLSLFALVCGFLTDHAAAAAAWRTRALASAGSVLALLALAISALAGNRLLDLVRAASDAHAEWPGRLGQVFSSAPGVSLIALSLVCALGIAPVIVIPTVGSTRLMPLLALALGVLCNGPLDPFVRSEPLIDSAPASFGAQYGVAGLALGAAGLCALFCGRPLLSGQAGREAPASPAPSRAKLLAAIEVEVRRLREGPHGAPAIAPAVLPAAQAIPEISAAGGAATVPAAGVPSVHCAACDAPLPSGALFCSACGQEVRASAADAAVLCDACGAPHQPADSFCARCGARFGGASEVGR